MKEMKNVFYDKVYFRGVMIYHDAFQSISSTNKIFGFDFKAKKQISEADSFFCMIKHRSRIRPPRYFISRQENNNQDEFIFPLCCLDVEINKNKKALFFSAPSRDLLEENRPKERDINYVRCNLNKICFDKYKGFSSKIQLTRLNGRFTSEFGKDVTSMALFGADVVTNKFILDVLDLKENSKKMIELNPFVGSETDSRAIAKSKQKRNLIPNSCRLKFDDGINSPASLNIDAFGNYSFYLQNEDTFFGINKIFQYINLINSFEADVTFDPLKRSARALELIS